MNRDDCLFCKIIRGEIPSSKVYEDEYVYAFDDVSPQMPVHTLIVPKNHYDSISDGVPADELGHLFAAVEKVADILLEELRDDSPLKIDNTPRQRVVRK